MGLFGKSKSQLERENQLLREMLAKQSTQKTTVPKSAPKVKKIMYQCRYCSYKSIRNATEGVPLPGTTFPDSDECLETLQKSS